MRESRRIQILLNTNFFNVYLNAALRCVSHLIASDQTYTSTFFYIFQHNEEKYRKTETLISANTQTLKKLDRI